MTDLPSDVCPKCGGNEGEFYVVDGNTYWRDCECLIQKRQERLIQASQITEEFRKKTFKSFDYKTVSDLVKQAYFTAGTYAKEFETIKNNRSNGLALIGRPGAGKTHLLMAAANRLLEKGVEVIYFPWVEGLADLKSDFDKLEEKVSRLQRCQVLYIDDLFKGRKEPTEFQLEQIFALINYRYLNKLPVMISSEWTISRMCDFDEATGSRIKEMCRDHLVVLDKDNLNYRLRDDT